MRFLVFILPMIAMAELPEKLMPGVLQHELGGVVLSSSNIVANNYDITPIMFYRSLNKPYVSNSYKLTGDQGRNKVGLITLEPGVYRIESLSFSAPSLGLVSEYPMRIYFRVIKDKINYIGRMFVSTSNTGAFKFEVKDKYDQDLMDFSRLYKTHLKVHKCLARVDVMPFCEDEA